MFWQKLLDNFWVIFSEYLKSVFHSNTIKISFKSLLYRIKLRVYDLAIKYVIYEIYLFC